MRRAARPTLLLLFLLAQGLLGGSAASGDPADKEMLVGAWRFQKEVLTRPDGTLVDGAAVPSEGFLVYTANGFLSVQIFPKGRKWTDGKPTPEQVRETLDGTSYAGRYELDPKSRTVTHHVEVSVDPAYEGRKLVRSYRFENGALLLSGDAGEGSERLRFTITWVRAE